MFDKYLQNNGTVKIYGKINVLLQFYTDIFSKKRINNVV